MAPLMSCFLLLAFLYVPASMAVAHEAFPRCFFDYTNSIETSPLLYASNTTSFSAAFLSSVQNNRFLSPELTRPTFIITPTHPSQVQAAVICGRRHGLRVRVRSGGHDYEGMSYVSAGEPFFILDLANFQSVDVNTAESTGWVGAGATLGQVYYSIAAKNATAGFPAGVAPSVGAGGHLSGGGLGMLLRKYGTASDNVIDAVIVDAQGRLLNRESMGEDLFWAIRGGGASNFGVVISYKINLVAVTPKVTVFRFSRSLKQGVAKLVEKWQHVAPNLDDDIFLRIMVTAASDPGAAGKRTIRAIFECLFLGEPHELLATLGESFPELDVKASDCMEMSWIESVAFFGGHSNKELSTLIDRKPYFGGSFKAKSDFVREPISAAGWEEILEFLLRGEGVVVMVMDPCGGRMDEIAEDAIPFPHRKGNLYNIQHAVSWSETEDEVNQKHLRWMSEFYEFMTPYVARNPRAIHLNYKDIDLGRNESPEKTSYVEAKVWGRAYFLDNFERLAEVKAQVDPTNYFWNEQSIPPFPDYQSA